MSLIFNTEVFERLKISRKDLAAVGKPWRSIRGKKVHSFWRAICLSVEVARIKVFANKI